MDRYAKREMALRVAFKDRDRVRGLPKTLLKAVRDLGTLVREKSRKELTPRLRGVIRDFGDLVRKYKSRGTPELARAEELIMRDPERLEEALGQMSPEQLKRLERETVRAMGAIGSPFWASHQ